MPDEPGVYVASTKDEPLRQGEILSAIVHFHLETRALKTIPADGETAPIARTEHPLVIVISQDCDLDWDFKGRRDGKAGKEVPNVLFCEVVEAQYLPNVDSRIWKRIEINKDERYQFLQKVPPDNDSLKVGLPEMAIDFKRYFTIPTSEVYFQLDALAKRRCRLTSPYLEHFAQRVFNFHARIGLPADHFSEPPQK